MGKRRKTRQKKSVSASSRSAPADASFSSWLNEFRAGCGRLLGASDSWISLNLDLFAIAALVIGFVIRFKLASLTYFDLDESYHSWLAIPPFPELWKTSHDPTHPPLLIMLTHYMRQISPDERVLRFIPVITGTLFPWFIYRWLGLIWTRTAGLAALVILVFTPMLAQLSSVLRQYTLGLLFLSIALYWLELALRDGSTKRMYGFAAMLWLAVVSAFPTAFFCGALGIYVLLRFREPAFTRRMKIIWAASQVAILATYTHFLFRQVLRLRQDHQGLVHDQQSYFAGMFPVTGGNPISFVLGGFFDQFVLTFMIDWMAWVTLVLFVLGAALVIWKARRDGWSRGLSYLSILLVPFALTCAASFAKTYPWGKSRQTIFLAVSIAIATAISWDWLLRRRATLVLLSALLVTPFWITRAEFDQLKTESTWDRRQFGAMIEFIRNKSPDKRLMVEGTVGMILCHYLGEDRFQFDWSEGETRAGEFRWYEVAGSWSDYDKVFESLGEYQKRHKIPDDEIIYVMDAAGWCDLCGSLDQTRKPPDFVSGEIRRYGNTAALIPVRAGYRPPAEETPGGDATDGDTISSAQ